MELNVIKEILLAIENHGIGVVVVAGIVYYGFKFIDIQFDKYRANRLDAYDLKSHHIFADLQRDLDYDVPRLALGTEGRTKLFTDMMRIKYATFLELSKPFIDQHKCEECRPECFYAKNIEFVTNLVNTYEERWRKEGIFEEAIQKFNEWHKTRVDMVVENIRVIADNKVYTTRNQKYTAMLDLYFYAMRWALFDAELSLHDLNGEITGKVYKGYIC